MGDTKGCKIIAVIRHGKQQDGDAASNQIDPALTHTGQQQAFRTGNYFAQKYLKSCEKDTQTTTNVRIISSPFLRTLQTALNIAKEVKCSQIEVWDPVCEQLGEQTFASFPLPLLTYYSQHAKIHEQFLEEGVKLIKMEDPEHIMGEHCYPEMSPDKSQDWKNRVEACLSYLKRTQFSKTHDDMTIREMIIVLTHAFFLDPFVKYFSNGLESHKDWNHCAVGVAEATTSAAEWTLIENVSSEHLN